MEKSSGFALARRSTCRVPLVGYVPSMDERARRVFRSFMVGSAVAATLATLEAANDPALAATGLTASPSIEESGTSPAVTLNWTTAMSPVTTIRVAIGAFTTSSASDCSSSPISLTVGGTTRTIATCTWDSVSRSFVLTVPGLNALPLSLAQLTFPTGLLTAGAVGTTQMTVNDDGVSAIASNTISFTSGSSPYPPDWFQSYQRGSAVEACQTTWNPSWAMWANNGTGGFVCVRTTYFDPRLATWSYR